MCQFWLIFVVSNCEYNRYDDRKNNLLLTFVAAGSRDYEHISHDQFDKTIQNDLCFTLEKPTEKQKIRLTTIFNGNRYYVIRKQENLASIPNFISILDPNTKAIHHI